jgi:hypothetical protein
MAVRRKPPASANDPMQVLLDEKESFSGTRAERSGFLIWT